MIVGGSPASAPGCGKEGQEAAPGKVAKSPATIACGLLASFNEVEAAPADKQSKTVDGFQGYWMHGDGNHNVYAHYGVRTHRHKLIHFYNDGCGQPGSGDERHPPEWELFDLQADRNELRSLYHDEAHAAVRRELTDELHRLQEAVGDERYPLDDG